MILWQKLSSKWTYIALITLLLLLACVSCNNANVDVDTTYDSRNTRIYSEEGKSVESTSEQIADISPTGLSEGMITPPQIMYQGVVYEYRFYGKSNNLPNGFEEVGTVLTVDDYEIPNRDFCAGGREINLSVGQQVYASEDDQSRIVVFCDDGYYLFYCDD